MYFVKQVKWKFSDIRSGCTYKYKGDNSVLMLYGISLRMQKITELIVNITILYLTEHIEHYGITDISHINVSS